MIIRWWQKSTGGYKWSSRDTLQNGWNLVLLLLPSSSSIAGLFPLLLVYYSFAFSFRDFLILEVYIKKNLISKTENSFLRVIANFVWSGKKYLFPEVHNHCILAVIFTALLFFLLKLKNTHQKNWKTIKYKFLITSETEFLQTKVSADMVHIILKVWDFI